LITTRHFRRVALAWRVAEVLQVWQIFNPLGDLIGEINLPGTVNFTFGGPGHNILFITTDDAIWAAVLANARADRS
jgi:sugar lactone lactonase YvrE